MRNWEKSSLAFALVFGFAMTARSQSALPGRGPAAPVAARVPPAAAAAPSTAAGAIPGPTTAGNERAAIAATAAQPGVQPAQGLPEEVTVEPLPLPAAPTMSFEEAIRQSVLRNSSAQVAKREIERFEALARQTRAAWLPTLTGNGTYTRLDSDRVRQGQVLTRKDQFAANLTLNVPIVMPQQWAASSRAGDQIDVARTSRADVARTVAVSVGKAYLLVVSQRRLLEVSRSARVTAFAHYEFSRLRFLGGLGNKVDVVRAAQELATDDGLIEQARISVIRAREALGALIGLQTPVDAIEPALDEPPTQESALKEAETQRSDVQAQKYRMQAANHSSSLNYTEYLPYLNAIVQPFYQHPASFITPTTGWQAQLVLTVPLYDGGLRYGRADERAAVSEEAQATLDGLLRQARSEVRTAFSAVMSAEATLSSNRRAARLADQALQLAILAYRAGATGNLEVIDAERRARDASIQVAAAEDALRQARLDLLAASGRFPSAEAK